MVRLVLGLLVAIICALAVTFAGGLIFGALAMGGETDWRIGALVAWGASLFVIPAILVLTIPFHLLGTRLERTRSGEYGFVGALVGLSTFLVVQVLTWGDVLEFPGQMLAPGLVIAPLSGAVAALAFWVVARPDQRRSKRLS